VYRDDPLADEAELRDLLGDDAVDGLHGPDDRPRGTDPSVEPVAVAVDVLRVLQGWVDDEDAARWFVTPQRRLDGRTPLVARRAGAVDEVRDAARLWAAAQG
jgi:hypothetical protein